jgi:iron complex transport system ATP-binding protein
MLQAKEIHLSRGGRAILKAINLDLPTGQITTMIGPNGAGKSSLLKILSGEWLPSQGQVSMQDRLLSEFSPSELAKMRALVPQSSSLSFDFSIREVVSMGVLTGASESTEDLVAAALNDVGLEAQALQTYTSLSGGEKQRTHIARALVQVRSFPSKKDRYLLLDEPSSSLDLVYTERLMRLIKSLAEDGLGVFLIMHDVNLASAWSDQVLVLAKGKLVAQGCPGAVIIPHVLRDAFEIEPQIIAHPHSGRPLVLPSVPPSGLS